MGQKEGRCIHSRTEVVGTVMHSYSDTAPVRPLPRGGRRGMSVGVAAEAHAVFMEPLRWPGREICGRGACASWARSFYFSKELIMS
jgi:hypothetical protein